VIENRYYSPEMQGPYELLEAWAEEAEPHGRRIAP
jgi:hypothetical protein